MQVAAAPARLSLNVGWLHFRKCDTVLTVKRLLVARVFRFLLPSPPLLGYGLHFVCLPEGLPP